MSDPWRPHGLQHARPACPSPSPWVCSNSCPLSWWCHPTISSSVTPFCSQSFPVSGSFPMSWLFARGGQSIGASASASALLMSIQGWLPLRLTGLISLLSKRLYILLAVLELLLLPNTLHLSWSLRSVPFPGFPFPPLPLYSTMKLCYPNSGQLRKYFPTPRSWPGLDRTSIFHVVDHLFAFTSFLPTPEMPLSELFLTCQKSFWENDPAISSLRRAQEHSHLNTCTYRQLLKQVILISVLFSQLQGELENRWEVFFSFSLSREQASLEPQKLDRSCPQGEITRSLFLKI